MDIRFQPIKGLLGKEGWIEELLELFADWDLTAEARFEAATDRIMIELKTDPDELPGEIRNWLAERMVESSQKYLEWQPVEAVDETREKVGPLVRLYWSGLPVRANGDGSWRINKAVVKPIK